MALKVVLKSDIKKKVGEFEKISTNLRKNHPKEVFRALSILEAAIKNNIRYRSGLKVRSGMLLNSVQKQMTVSPGEISGWVGPVGVPYAPTHELGAVIPAHTVSPRNAKVLRWFDAAGNPIFARKVEIPSFIIKARPYLAPAVEEQGPVIQDKFGLFVERIISKELSDG